MNLRIIAPAALVIALALAGTASASEITGTLTAGGSNVTGTVIGIPTASPAPGTYATAQSVTLTDPGSSSIRFTTDGSASSCSGGGNLYTAPIAVASSLMIQAVACYPSGQSSTIGSYAYTISSGALSGTVATSSAGTLSGTVTSSPGGSLSGTVTAPSSGGGGGGGGVSGSNGPPASGGSGGGGGGAIIPTGVSTPPGQVLGATTGPTTPGVPNTGAGGNAIEVLLLLIVSGTIAFGGALYLVVVHSRRL